MNNAYDVFIAPGLLAEIGKQSKQVICGNTIAIITDDIVASFYGKETIHSLESAGFSVKSFVFPHGESQKNMATLNSALEFLAENHLTRTDGIIALGGGVVGDLAGLATALYLRGIKFIQIPTTLLAAIDSSIGGKTAVDLKAGKNLAGVFYKPSLVLCDTSTLKTLPPETLLDGIAEALKCGVLFDHELFDRVASSNFNEYETSIITDCVEWKRKVVEQDEFEAGTRQLLNLGHTIGHAIEKCSEFTITHGHAVAAGMAIIARSAAASGFCDSDCPRQIEEALSRLGLPSNSTFSAEALAQAALSDKKRRGDKITLVIPKEIGFCILHPLPIDQLTHFIQMGLTKQ